uniref:Pre-rRNA-processing protein TSR2, putative n=1 Tax=Theileria annulata TaxID=5874 RepID=A0A3B0MSR0_THEAN
MSNPSQIFSTACKKVLDCWTALNLAVENNWGGDDSELKKELLVRNVIEFCLESIEFMNKEIYSDQIEDIIVDKIDEYFNVTLEDGSEIEIASILVKLHLTCSNNDFTYANELINNLKKCSNPCISGNDESSEEEKPEKLKGSSRGPKTVRDEEGWTTIL